MDFLCIVGLCKFLEFFGLDCWEVGIFFVIKNSKIVNYILVYIEI